MRIAGRVEFDGIHKYTSKTKRQKSNNLIIDVETHFYPTEYIARLKERSLPPRFVVDSDQSLVLEYSPDIQIPRQKLLAKFTELETRQRDMARDKIDMQVLSVPLPGVDKLDIETSIEMCRVSNDELAEICEKHPDNFCAFALLPIQSGEAAVDELRRAVSDLGLKGGFLHSNCEGNYLDSRNHLLLFKEAQRLGVPVFVHPTIPFDHVNMQEHRLASTFGLQVDLSLSLLRLIFSGVMEQLENLKLIVSHLGSTLPFISNRIDDEFGYAIAPETKIRGKPSQYIKKMYVDTATMDPEPLEFAKQYFGSGHIIFGSDYPFWDTSLHVNAVEKSSLSIEDRRRIYSENVASLLKIRR
jgi:2,3-dihydroxybenzoate decarboxylase